MVGRCGQALLAHEGTDDFLFFSFSGQAVVREVGREAHEATRTRPGRVNVRVQTLSRGSESTEQRNERGGGGNSPDSVRDEEQFTSAVTISCRYSRRP